MKTNQIYSKKLTFLHYIAEGFGAWDSRNCRVLNENETNVQCGCDHLTHFAILLVSDIFQEVCGLLVRGVYTLCYHLHTVLI